MKRDRCFDEEGQRRIPPQRSLGRTSPDCSPHIQRGLLMQTAQINGTEISIKAESGFNYKLNPDFVPLIVGLGGTMRPSSSTERLLGATLAEVEVAGGSTIMLNGEALNLPLYSPHTAQRSERAQRLVDAVRKADGIIIASPGYHGTISGHMKNALDYIEDLRIDRRPYLEGRAVGCCAAAMGWQASVTTLVALRSVVHALRGWPTPLGVAVNSTEQLFAEDGEVVNPQLKQTLHTLARQVVDFARMRQTQEGC